MTYQSVQHFAPLTVSARGAHETPSAHGSRVVPASRSVAVSEPASGLPTPLHPALRPDREGWVASVGLDPADYGTHSMRRTKATLIYRRTGNLRAVQLLLGHTKIESTVRYLGVEVDDALALSEQTDV